MNELSTYIRAGFACLQIVTAEEERAIEYIMNVAKKELANKKRINGYSVWTWAVTKGLRDECGSLVDGDKEEIQKSKDPMVALGYFISGTIGAKSITILKDFHMYLKQPNPMLIRLLKEAISFGRQTGRHLIIVGCQINMQPELEKEILTIDMPLPDRAELEKVATNIATAAKMEVNGDIPAVVEALTGLTTNEAADAVSFSVSKHKKLVSKTIAKIKTDTIRKNGVIDVVEDRIDMNQVGGLDGVKSWLNKRVKAFSPDAVKFGIQTPRGILACGISGTGKSLIAKSIASLLNTPMLRLDGGNVYAGLVGESERRMRTALKTAEAMAPCVLLFDEIEKSLSGGASSGHCDGGTTSRVISTFLQWMQDRKAAVFVVATANDVSQLPPETLRRGRFDQVFFVDLPDEEERKQIWSVHIKKSGRNPKSFDLNELSGKTEGYTGAELESIVSDGLINAFHDNKELDTNILIEAIKETVPISTTMKEKITAMKRWADGRAISASGRKQNEKVCEKV